jgi:HPt (histidine-containing phosphotransfer) domain-containing protein
MKMTDFSVLAERLGLDQEEFIELVELFLDTSGSDLEKLESAIKKNDADTIAKAAHSLKGASGSLGLTDISEIARQVESISRTGCLEGAFEQVCGMKEKIYELGESLKG